jgi:hypothetical protein
MILARTHRASTDAAEVVAVHTHLEENLMTKSMMGGGD